MNTIESASNTVLEAMRQRERDYIERKALGATEPTAEQIEFAKRYWDAVFSQPMRQPVSVAPRNAKQEMDYGDARKKFWATLQIRAAHIEDMDGVPFNWVFDEDQTTVIRDILKYFINDPTSKYALSKGLFVYGAPGTGKTEVMMAFSKFCESYDLSKKFKMKSLSEIYTRAKADKDSDPITPNIQGDTCFDEFGRYIGPVVRFGDSLDINEAIIEQRYERSRRYGQITHFIANATPNELDGSFTPMIFDRLRAMCTSIHFSGKSKRK